MLQKSRRISHVIFLQYPQQNDGKEKDRERQGGKTHYKNGRRGRIRKPSGTGTISSQHLPQNLVFLQACQLLTASASVWLLFRGNCEGAAVLAMGRKHKERPFFTFETKGIEEMKEPPQPHSKVSV